MKPTAAADAAKIPTASRRVIVFACFMTSPSMIVFD
jgi:hypothetical protein